MIAVFLPFLLSEGREQTTNILRTSVMSGASASVRFPLDVSAVAAKNENENEKNESETKAVWQRCETDVKFHESFHFCETRRNRVM